jgi:hypothetical protein
MLAGKGEFPETNIEFSTVQIGAHKVGGTIKVTDEIVQDSQFDIRSEVITEFGVAFETADETVALFMKYDPVFATTCFTPRVKSIMSSAVTVPAAAVATCMLAGMPGIIPLGWLTPVPNKNAVSSAVSNATPNSVITSERMSN